MLFVATRKCRSTAYLEKIFPFMGIRFISITDGYDSAVSGDAEKALMVPLKNMINTAYAKDISRKMRMNPYCL